MLLVVGAGHLGTHPLAPGARLVIGRDESCDVTIEHPKVSRKHAIVRGDEPTASVEDAGGTNRVRVGQRQLDAGQKTELRVGESFQVGPFTVLLLGMPSPIGESADGRAALVIRDVRAGALTDLVARVATSDVSVLIRGETGTGKEVLARSLHAASKRKGPLVSINCAALNEALLESELFGHERGAFTGAVQAKQGLFETAAGGTVFLDEIAEMPIGVQAKLLRALESRQVMRLGGLKPVELDVRFFAATHRDLRAAVSDGKFRQDLYFRINGITIVVVPLRERKDVIPSLVTDFLADAAARAGRKTPVVDAGALARLAKHDWPGNVRELKAVVERAMLLAPGDRIEAKHVMIDTPVAGASPPPAPTTASGDGDDAERAKILAALDECAGNQTRAAKALGISRATLAHKLALHRIPRPRKP